MKLPNSSASFVRATAALLVAVVALALLPRPAAGRPPAARATPAAPPAQDVSVPDRCAGCHSPPVPYHYGLACHQCHSASRFLPAKVARPPHPLPLVGRHATIPCAGCHAAAPRPAAECASCHKAPKEHLAGACTACHTPAGWAESARAAGITGPSAPHLISAKDDCLVCHAPSGPNWPAPASHTAYARGQCGLCHDSSAKVTVSPDHGGLEALFQGSHTVLACLQCHSSGQFQGTGQACISCHQDDDRHAGQLGRECARCHNPQGWAGASFNHEETGFPLAGAHSGASCLRCHAGGAFAGTPTACVACHEDDDRHAGQFGQDCARCHNPQGWAGASFDHGETGFPLTGAHGGVACSSCHGGGVYDGTPTECGACHAEPAYHAGVLGTGCAACHTTGGWLPATYGGPHTFPMSHGGAGGCRTCHPGSLGGYTCFGCHNQAELAEKHEEEGIPDWGNCMACHPGGGGG